MLSKLSIPISKQLIVIMLIMMSGVVVSASNAIAVRNERLALGQIRRMYEVQANFFRTDGGHEVFGNGGQLSAAGLIDEALAGGSKFGYRFTITTLNGPGYSDFQISARPEVYGKTGVRSFFMNSACKITGGDKGGAEARNVDPEIEDACKPTLMIEAEQVLIGRLRNEITKAEDAYFNRFFQYTQDLNALWSLRLISPEIGRQVHRNYAIIPFPVPDPVHGWAFNAVPIFNYREVRALYVDQTGVVRGAFRTLREPRPGPGDPPVE